jgi:hypothetical protein
VTRRVFRLLSAAGTGCGGLRVQLHSGYGCDMIDLELRSELLAMKSEDEELHTELSSAGALTGHYVPSLQAVHERNAARLREIVLEHGWPNEERVGPDGAYATWLIVQHGIGNPSLQRGVLPLQSGGDSGLGKLPTIPFLKHNRSEVVAGHAVMSGFPTRRNLEHLNSVCLGDLDMGRSG